MLFEGYTRWLWDGNKPLHEWKEFDFKEGSADDLITWIFEADSFTPTAKIKGEKKYSIVSDHLGTPTQGYNEAGELIWDRELDSYGKVRMQTGDAGFCNYLYQGLTLDPETELAYNRFRYYNPEEGCYISQDPIRLKGGLQLYSYVKDTTNYIDPFGLSTVYLRNNEVYTGKAKVNARGRYGNTTTATDIFTDIPNLMLLQRGDKIWIYEERSKTK